MFDRHNQSSIVSSPSNISTCDVELADKLFGHLQCVMKWSDREPPFGLGRNPQLYLIDKGIDAGACYRLCQHEKHQSHDLTQRQRRWTRDIFGRDKQRRLFVD